MCKEESFDPYQHEFFKDHLVGSWSNYVIRTFEQTPPISTYIFNLCAGDFKVITNQAESKVPMKIYLRPGREIDSDEHFRIITAGIKFYEELTGIDFPFSKYD